MRSSPYRCACVVVSAPPQGYVDSVIKASWHKAFSFVDLCDQQYCRIPGRRDCRSVLTPVSVGSRVRDVGDRFWWILHFSTMMNESRDVYLRGGRITVFVGYVLTSVVVPVMAAALGYCLVV